MPVYHGLIMARDDPVDGPPPVEEAQAVGNLISC